MKVSESEDDPTGAQGAAPFVTAEEELVQAAAEKPHLASSIGGFSDNESACASFR